MPVINRTLSSSSSHNRLVYFVLARHLSTSARLSRDSQFQRHDFLTEGVTTTVEVRPEVRGPLAKVSKHGAPVLTPSLLKEHLDKFVVGQDKAKKVTSVAIYNHYQRIREIKRQEQEEADRREREERGMLMERERNTHPVENEFPGHTVKSADLNHRPKVEIDAELGSKGLALQEEIIIEKSNLLLLGPSGVGKTYILSTLAKVLEVPFATIDCSALTQAGYIGTDVESSIERLLLAANHNIAKCETGIIFLDELDKLAKPAVMTHGRDVSGEGVQQGLLKMIEGTSVTVNAKTDRNSKSENSRGSDRMDRGGRDANSNQGKSEQYTIDTSNILFVFAGAFVGLDRVINTRLASGTSIGFGAQLKKEKKSEDITRDNPLQYVTPGDLQSYGLIPELLGRIPILTALHPLTLDQLVSILTEPRNSLVKQYTALLGTSNIQLKFTTPALRAIAERALISPLSGRGSENKATAPGGGGGARGLRAIMESVLGEIMFWGPGSNIRFCLVDEKFVRGQDVGSSQFTPTKNAPKSEKTEEGKSLMPRCWSRGQGKYFEEAYEKEEEDWHASEDVRKRRERREPDPFSSFEAYREVGTSGM